MKRREFIKKSATATAAVAIAPAILGCNKVGAQPRGIVLGYNTHQYELDYRWGQLDPGVTPVNDCHEMVQDSRKRIALLTNETRNNVIIYDPSGKYLDSWGTEYPGAHGLTLWSEGGEDMLFICDYERHEVIKTTIDGKVLMTLPFPADSGKYKEAGQYKPTESAIAPNGDIYVVDGYGEQYVMRYNHKGELLQVFGGRGEAEDKFFNAHGICIDNRDKGNPIVLVTARQKNQFKRFSLDGEYLSTIEVPGAFVCRPVIHDDHIYAAVLMSKAANGSKTGFVVILDGENKVVSTLGGSMPEYEDGKLKSLHQTVRVFQHPHDVLVDNDENLYVAQWNSGKIYPIKLNRV